MELARRVTKDFRRSVWSFVAYELLFRVVLVTILSPVGLWALYRLVASSGHSAVSNEAIAAFLLSPIGVVTALGAGAFTLGVLFTQRAGIIVLAASPGRSPWRPLGALLTTARLAPPLLRLGLLQFALLVLAALPFAAAGAATWWLLLSDHDINFYLATRPPRFLAALAVGGVLLVGCGLVLATLWVRWCLNVPIVIDGERSARRALRESARLVRGRFWPIARAVVSWAVLVLLVALVVTIGVDFIVRQLLAATGENLTLVIPIVASFIAVQLGSVFAFSFLWFNVHCLLTAELYAEVTSRSRTRAADDRAVAGAEVTAKQRRSVLGTVGVAMLVLLVMTVVVSHRIATRIETLVDRRVEVTAHRGSSRAAPENSISAIERAIRDGADMAEIDVQELRDGTIVVAHDTDLMRTTGVARNIWDIDYTELRELDAGSWFAPEFAGEHVPTLEEAIETARGRLALNIELKVHGHEQAFVQRVVEIIERETFVDQCVVTSLDYDGLMEVKRRNDRIEVGFIVSAVIGDLLQLDVDFLSLQRSLATPRRVNALHARGRGVHVWTVNEPRAMRQMIAYNVDSIITDEPATAVAIMRELEEMSVVERLLVEFRDEFLR